MSSQKQSGFSHPDTSSHPNIGSNFHSQSGPQSADELDELDDDELDDDELDDGALDDDELEDGALDDDELDDGALELDELDDDGKLDEDELLDEEDNGGMGCLSTVFSND